MLKVSKPSANRVDLALCGVLDADGMRTALDTLIAQSEGVKNGKMLYTVSDIQMPTLGAMAVELYRMPKLMGLLGKFDKCAVLSDTGWIRTAAEVEGVILPSLAIKSFTLNEIQAAEAWLEHEGDHNSDDPDTFENMPL